MKSGQSFSQLGVVDRSSAVVRVGGAEFWKGGAEPPHSIGGCAIEFAFDTSAEEYTVGVGGGVCFVGVAGDSNCIEYTVEISEF
jgi:hypothetical protein